MAAPDRDPGHVLHVDGPPACDNCGDDGCGVFLGQVLCPSCAEGAFDDGDEYDY